MPRVKVNQINLHYELSGLGFPIVFCHGFARSHQDWIQQVAVLDSKYMVLTYDHRGHGSSDAPDDYSMKILADDLAHLLDLLAVRSCYLVGHSMGGMVAQQFTLDYPTAVAKLVLVDTGSKTTLNPKLESIFDEIDRLVAEDGLSAAFEYIARLSPWSQERYQKYPQRLEESRRLTCDMSPHAYTRIIRAMQSWDECYDRLGDIAVPTLVIAGEQDVPSVGSSRELSSLIRGARLEIIPSVGHYPFQDTTEEFNAILAEFLNQ